MIKTEKEIDKYKEKLHAYKANQARILQLQTMEEEQQWADREYPTPKFYPQIRPTFLDKVKSLLNPFNPKHYLP